MGSLPTLNFPNGNIAFAGTVRVDDTGVKEFRVELPNRPPMFGEWRPKFADNGNDFDIEIATFGFVSKYNVRNPHPNARARFSAQEQSTVEELIRNLFANQSARASIPPFSTKNGRFLGGVDFSPGWIARSDA